jgi:hypothetical protein
MALKLKFGSSPLYTVAATAQLPSAAALTQVPVHSEGVGQMELTGRGLLLQPSTGAPAPGNLLWPSTGALASGHLLLP